MQRQAMSIQGVPIRLPDERWQHILKARERPGFSIEDVLQTISKPARVLQGKHGEFIAVREIAPSRQLSVVYRISNGDGFVITAFRISREGYFRNRKQLWP
jgi:hypothetical protein